MSVYASRYQESVLNPSTSLLVKSTALVLMQTGTGAPGVGTYVTTYTSRTKGTVASSVGAVTTDSNGNLGFYADAPGSGGVDIYQGGSLLMSDVRPVPDAALTGGVLPAGTIDLRSFSPHSDARYLYDVSWASGTTVTSATGAFTSADVGKIISMVQYNVQPAQAATTTITAVNSSTSITVALSTPYSGAQTNLMAVLGSDETPAFQAALNAMGTAGGGLCYVPPGTYLMSPGSSPLTLPSRALSSATPIAEIGFFCDIAPPEYVYGPGVIGASSPPHVEGAIVMLAAPTAGFDPIIAAASGGQNWTFVSRNMTWRKSLTANASGGLSMSNAAGLDVDRTSIDIFCAIKDLPQPPGSYPPGLVMPGLDNNAYVRASNTQIVGFGVGLHHTEHAVLDNVSIWMCRVGLAPAHSNHSSTYVRVLIVWCGIAIQPDQGAGAPGAAISGGHIAIEDAGGGQWYSPTAHLDDPNNLLRGFLTYYRVLAFTGNLAGWVQNGGTNVVVTDLHSAGRGAPPDQIPGAPTLALWLKADSLALSDGTAVATWNDSGPGGHNVVQATGGNKPIFKLTPAGFNGKPAVRFDGSTSFMTCSSLSLSSGSNYTLAVVAYRDTASTSFGNAFDARGTQYIGMGNDPGNRNVIFRAGNPTGTSQYVVDPAGLWIYIGVYNGAEADVFETNRLRRRIGITGAMTLGVCTVGCTDGLGTPSQFWPGDIAEIVLYTTALSEQQRTALYEHLAYKYAIN